MTPTHSPHSSNRRLWGAYFALQALACGAWWVGILYDDRFAMRFAPEGLQHINTLRTFWLADIVCVVGGSALCALLLHARHHGMFQAMWWTSGAITFATLYCLASWIDTQQGGLAVGLMAPATCLTLFAAHHCTSTDS